jgi:hypothetical protein
MPSPDRLRTLGIGVRTLVIGAPHKRLILRAAEDLSRGLWGPD